METARRYPDKWMWRYLAPVIAILAVHIANDNSFIELLQIPSYYTDVLFAIVFTYGCFWYVRYISYKLDNITELKTRLWKQALFGIGIPASVVIGSEILYLIFLLEIPLSESPIFYLELPITIIFLTLINLIYYIMHLRQHKENKAEIISYATHEIIPIPQSIMEDKEDVYFVVQSGQTQLSIFVNQIAYFYLENKCVWLVTAENERYILNYTLDQIQQRLDEGQFFRLNRQCIAQRNHIQKTSYTDTRKLEVELFPVNDFELFVSKANAGAFQRWWKN